MDNPHSAKRPRVTLACQRCKSRKQQCDGCNPCSKCRALNLTCEYVIPQQLMPSGENHYIRSLEHRVAELESLLSARGIQEPRTDHWRITTARSTTASGATASTSVPTDLDGAGLDWRGGEESVVSVLRSLFPDVNRSGYMGASSHAALGRLVSSLPPQSGRSQATQTYNPTTPTPNGFTSPSRPDAHVPASFSEIPADVADRVLASYMKHICTRRPVVHSLVIRDIHSRRDTLTLPYEISLLHLVYACGGRFLETTGDRSAPPADGYSFSPMRHYTFSLGYFDTVLSYRDTRTIAILTLMAVYCLRDRACSEAWTFSRAAISIAIDCGLHRQARPSKRPSLKSELKKRLFWTCYSVDRQISIAMGWPCAIADRNIRVALPLDVDEEITGKELFRTVGNINLAAEGVKSPGRPSSRTTSLSSFIHLVRLRSIESDIQQTIDRHEDCVPIHDHSFDVFLTDLEAWRSCIPADAREKKDLPGVPFDGYDFYLVFYFKTLRLLLYPQLTRAAHGEYIPPRFLKICARACAGACAAYKRLHQSLAAGFSIMALQTVFMAGLTLIYCIWISRADIFDMVTSNGINDCSIVLFVIAERVPAGKKYRNMFEIIRQRVIESIKSLAREDGRKPSARQVVVGLGREVAAEYRDGSEDYRLSVAADEGSFEQFCQIMTAMTGEDFSTTMGLKKWQ
ncbi:Fungal specific transcription factor domain containing protein [Naviculisporaceae sp. PSN 640]